MPNPPQQDTDALIPAKRLRQLHKAVARLASEGLRHPAAFAACALQLQANDAVWPAQLTAAARKTTGFGRAAFAGPRRAEDELLAAIYGSARDLARQKNGAVMLAMARERELLATEAIARGRAIARGHLPVVLLSFGRNLPLPGDSQKRIGIPEMTVAADDAVAVYRVAEEAFWRARTGVGPTWIRCASLGR